MKSKQNYGNLKSMWITGFVDGEASFHVVVYRRNSSKTGYSFVPTFRIELKDTDLSLLCRIQSFFGGIGIIYFLKTKVMLFIL